MEIHLIRHGKTLANENHLYCGHTDLPLSDRGTAELLRLKAQGIYPSAELFFTSGLLRTEQTIDAIYGTVRRKAVPGVAEYNFGLFEMKGYEELRGVSDYQAWIADSSGNVSCPEGESRNQFIKRVTESYSRLEREIEMVGAESAFISCHGGVVACLMESLFPNERDFYEWQPAPGRGYTVIRDSQGLRMRTI